MIQTHINLALFVYSAVHNWCTKWHVHLQLKDIAEEENILSDMHSLCDTTRMITIASIALLAEQEAITEDKLKAVPLKDSYSSMRSRSQVRVLPQVTEKMVMELYRLLDDTAEHVRVPSAVVLYCIDRQNQKVCIMVEYTCKHYHGTCTCIIYHGKATAKNST